MAGFQGYTASLRLVSTMNGAAISIDTPMIRLADGTIASGCENQRKKSIAIGYGAPLRTKLRTHILLRLQYNAVRRPADMHTQVLPMRIAPCLCRHN
jgi:hypothetical protein